MGLLTIQDILDAIDALPRIGAKEALTKTKEILVEIEEEYRFIDEKIKVLEDKRDGFKKRLQALSYLDLHFNAIGIKTILELASCINNLNEQDAETAQQIVGIIKRKDD